MRRQQPGSGRLACGDGPLAVVIELAHDPWRALIGAPLVELFLDLVFDQLAFFLDYENLLKALREAARALWFQWPGHCDLVEPDADVASHRLVDA